MKKCEISQRTVRPMIALLVAGKLVTIERRLNGNGSCTSNGYKLAIPDYSVNLTGRVVKLDRGRWSPVTPPLVSGGQVTTTEPVLYPTTTTTTSTTPTALPKPIVGDDGGSGSELCVPKTVTSSERRTLANQVQALSHDHAQQVLDELAGRMASKRVRSPVRYCAALIKSIRRGEFKPDVGSQIADRRKAEQLRKAQLRASPAPSTKTPSASTVRLPVALRAPFERTRRQLTACLPMEMRGTMIFRGRAGFLREVAPMLAIRRAFPDLPRWNPKYHEIKRTVDASVSLDRTARSHVLI